MSKDKLIRSGQQIPLRIECTALTNQQAAAQPEQVEAPASPPTASVADSSASPAGVDELDSNVIEGLTVNLQALSLQAIAEQDLFDEYEDALEWDDNAGHEEGDGDHNKWKMPWLMEQMRLLCEVQSSIVLF